MSWTSWTTRVVDIRLATWSTTVMQGHYVGECVKVSFMDILWGYAEEKGVVQVLL